MKILISNDDGVNAEGIKALANALCKEHSVRVVAPSGNCSGFSHSLTIRTAMKLSRGAEGYDDSVEVYALSGTPADAVKFGLDYFKDFVPDLVMTGINNGPNLAKDIMYSGTVGSATEAGIHQIAAIAVSLASYEKGVHFETAAHFALSLCEKLININRACVWNINVPDLPYEKVKGVKIVKTGTIHYADIYDRSEADGEESYFLGGEPLEDQSIDETTDVGAVNAGYVAVTPLLIDRTEYATLNFAKEALE